MSGTLSPDSIDVVAIDPDNVSVALYIVEDLPWADDDRRITGLMAKINYYVGVITSGELAAQYPECAGLPTRIQIDCIDLPTDRVADVLGYTQPKLAELNIDILVNVVGPR